jgi:sugar lactone lactonase YvrE
MRRKRVLAGPVLAALMAPGAALAAPADPYVIYSANNFADGAVILRTDPGAGSLVEISRNGPQGALFEAPFDLAVEADGSLLVADMGQLCTPQQPRCADDGRIIRVDPLTGRQSLLAGGPPLVDPAALAVGPNGDVYVADNFEADGGGAVIRIDPATGAKTLISEDNLLDLPFGILMDRDGSLVVSNRVAPTRCLPGLPGRLVRVHAANGSQRLLSEGGLFRYPLGVALDAAGRIVFANECGPNGLLRVVSEAIQTPLSPNGDGDVLVTPERLALDPAGDFLVSDWSLGDGDGGIAKVDAETGVQSLVRQGDLFNHPMGIAVVVNRPPIASLTPVRPVVAAGERVRLDASRSRDAEGLRLVYEWDLDGNGAFELGTGALSAATRAWRRDGRVTVRVRVNDPHGGSAVAQSVVAVDGSVPRITNLGIGSKVLGVGPRAVRGSGAEVARRATERPPRSTKLRFKLSESATVRVLLRRSSCRPPARRGRRCVRRSLKKLGRPGANTLRLRARGLRPGSYRVSVGARDAVGHEATKRTLRVRVVRLAP